MTRAPATSSTTGPTRTSGGELKRGGHDYRKVFAAYQAAIKHNGQPTVILAKTACAKLKVYAGQPVEQGQLLVENGTLFGELPAGGYDQITDNPLSQGADDDALDRAAMECRVPTRRPGRGAPACARHTNTLAVCRPLARTVGRHARPRRPGCW